MISRNLLKMQSAATTEWYVRGLTVRLAVTSDEREILIRLRTSIYRDVGKHSSELPMIDRFDDGAALIGVWRGDKPIACARVLIRQPDDEWEHDRFIEWDGYPERSNCAEISRLCILRKERTWKTLQAAFVGISGALLPAGRKYFVGCCTDELKHSYSWMFGVNFNEDVIRHEDLGSKPHHMFVCNYQYGMVGEGLDFLPWASLWSKLGLKSLLNGTLLGWEPLWKRLYWGALCAFGSLVSPLATRLIESKRSRRPRRESAEIADEL